MQINRGRSSIPFVDSFYGMRQTFVTDPDGHKLCFENQNSSEG